MISSKKLLSTLSTLGAISLTTSSVVSCGFNLSKIINRTISIDVMNTTFSYPVTSWNTAYTMQSEDQLVLANTNASLIALDPYGRLYGDIFKSNSDLSKNQVGVPSNNSQTWTYEMRKGLKWKKSNAEVVDEIKPSDLLKTAWFALYNNVTSSSVGSLWKGFIKGATELSTQLNSGNYKTYDDFKKAYDNDELTNFGLKVDDSNYTVTFELTKPAPYFESLLAYSAFSPVYSSTTDRIEKFSSGYYSGAYLPTEVSSTKMTLKKNEDYHFASEVTVKEINYISISGGNVSSTRTLFEAGNITGFTVASGDTLGWNRYVGDDMQNPIFDRMYDAPSARQTSTFVFYFNVFNGNLISNPTNQQYIGASKLLQNKDVRGFLATSIDRSEQIRYYSQKYDGTSSTSSMLRNTYTSPTVGTDENQKDYTEYLADIAREKTNSNNSTILKDGTDFLLDKSEELGLGKRTELIEKINDYIQSENIQKNSFGKVVLEFLANPDLNTTLNPYITMMVNKFNNIENNPIQINITHSASSADYQALAQAGKFDLYSGGWGPDFADPATFLATIAREGDLRHYTGTSRFFKDDTNALSLESLQTSSTNAYVSALESYTNDFKEIDENSTSNLKERFEKFAEIEYKFMYEDFMFMPTMTAALPKNFTVSHLIPHSTTYTTTYGISNYKLLTAQISPKLLTANELKKVYEDYASKLLKIQETPEFEKENHVFWK